VVSATVKTDKIYLVGFMGAGKSTVATALAARLGWEVADTDHLVEAREGRTIADIFAREGESYFREIERTVIQELIPRRRVVVATGGGTFVDPTNRSAINSDGVSVWLDVSFETVLERIPRDGDRPLAADRTAMRELWEVRRAAYGLAHVELSADDTPVTALVEGIIDRSGVS
jgi:shikimate kinase